MAKDSISLLELCQRIKEELANGFGWDRIWIRAEISSYNVSRGHRYLQLVEEEQGRLNAKISANIWANTFQALNFRFRSKLEDYLQPGTKVLLLVRVDYHEVYGLKLNVDDIDPAYTLGEMARRKEAVIEKIKAKGWDKRNKKKPFPLVPQKIALIASSRSAGYADFMAQLKENSMSYAFEIELFESGVQGERAQKELVEAFDQVDPWGFDVLVLIRGGGSQIDLDVFNSEAVCEAIAYSGMPVLTGLGHETDLLLADVVAFKSFKTPTAVASFLYEQLYDFEQKIDFVYRQILDKVNERVGDLGVQEKAQKERFSRYIPSVMTAKMEELRTFAAQLNQATRERFLSESNNRLKAIGSLKQAKRRILTSDRNVISTRLKRALENKIDKEEQKRIHFEKSIAYLSPQKVLERGYSITTFAKGLVAKNNLPKKGDELRTIFAGGKVVSIFKATENED